MGGKHIDRRLVLAGPALLAVAPAAARAFETTVREDAQARGGRLAVNVAIDGQGPFRFVIDSAASASVIATDLANRLALPPAGQVAMNTVVAREIVPTVRAGRLRCGALDAEAPRLVLADRAAMNGADGLIGVDLLEDLRLTLTFRGGRRSVIGRSRSLSGGFLDPRLASAPLGMAGRRAFGQLLTVPARSGRAEATAIIDTGAEVTIINGPMAQAARARPASTRNGDGALIVRSPTGRSTSARAMSLPDLGFAGARLGELPVLAADLHTFAYWGLADRPAILLGVDVLALFGSATIDLRRGRLTLGA